VKDAGLRAGPDLTPHALRHTFGSLMLAYGHPLVTVSAWLGHTRTSTTERAYLHQIRSIHDEAGDRMRAQMDARETVNTDPFPVIPAESPRSPRFGRDAGFRAISGRRESFQALSTGSIPVARFHHPPRALKDHLVGATRAPGGRTYGRVVIGMRR
jgi:Phage integrase family